MSKKDKLSQTQELRILNKEIKDSLDWLRDKYLKKKPKKQTIVQATGQ